MSLTEVRFPGRCKGIIDERKVKKIEFVGNAQSQLKSWMSSAGDLKELADHVKVRTWNFDGSHASDHGPESPILALIMNFCTGGVV